MFYKIAIVFFLGLVFFPMGAQADNAAVVLAGLLNNIQTLQADFTQTITDNQAKLLQKSIGHMALQRPGKFRWEVIQPVAQWVVANRGKLWIYDPDLEQVTVRLLTKEAGETPALLLSNPNVKLEKDFSVQVIKNSPAFKWFLLIPKSSASMLAFIKIGFANNQIREIDLQDHLGHNTVVEFYNIALNQVLSAALFSLRLSSKVDVIDETKRRD
jgi:outer membrane lipoprotein carrier protein